MGDTRSFVFAIEDTETTQGLCKIIGRSSRNDKRRISGPNNLYFEEPELGKRHAILCIKTPKPKIQNVPSIEQIRICIRDLNSRSGIVNLESDGPHDEIDLKSGDKFGLIAVVNHSLHDSRNLAAKLIFKIKLEYFDEEKELIRCSIENVTFQKSPVLPSSPVYSKLADDSESSWYGLSEASIQTGTIQECCETGAIMTRGGRFSILSLREKDTKRHQKSNGSFRGKLLKTNSFQEETDTDTTEEEGDNKKKVEKEQVEAEEEEEEEDIELEIIRVKKIRSRPKTENTFTSSSRNKRDATPPGQSNSVWVLLIIILLLDRLLSN
ncbi:hypothetical protein N7582_002098 [Saccharomyces uvarum]|uniref:FHA domain-containing protein n=1 Tax=Saccharomyces uvarum TaxID=230603 RepID=A0AA35NTK0_SACUV|nr:hypothetical protein N7582_002098 [Saccharomyces uvarum]CAI4062305.1 hypothetical protein SUVC_07G1660 [Saccharomyces uvarum]